MNNVKNYVPINNVKNYVRINNVKNYVRINNVKNYVPINNVKNYVPINNVKTYFPINPFPFEWVLRALIDFTPSNARRFYSSMKIFLDGKGLTTSKTTSLLTPSRSNECQRKILDYRFYSV